MRTILILVAAICGACTEQPDVSSSVAKAIADCRAIKFPTAVAQAQCANDAEAPYLGRGDSDLVRLRFATRLALAEKVDRKTITTAEAALAFARFNSEATELAQRRQAQNTANTLAAINIVNSIQRPNQSINCTSTTSFGLTNTLCN